MTVNFLLRFYRAALRMFPSGFRAEFEDEMMDVFRHQLGQAAIEGLPAMCALLLREVGGLVGGGLRRRLTARPVRSILLARTGSSVEMPLDEARLAISWKSVLGLLVLFAIAVFLFNACQSLWYVTLDGAKDVRHVALGDFNGDDLPDAFLSIGSIGDGYWRSDKVMINQGNGRFVDSGQELGEWRSFAGATADMDADGRVDVISGNYIGLFYFRNTGDGVMESNEYGPRDFVHRSSLLNVAVADLNGDGRLDVFTTGCCGWITDSAGTGLRHNGYSEVWFNDGQGGLIVGEQKIGDRSSNAVALGDLNGDGSIDAFLANGQDVGGEPPFLIGERLVLRLQAMTHGDFGPLIFTYRNPNTVWFNDGQGHFIDSGQQLGHSESLVVALGDVNGDGSLDAVVGNNGADELWLNDGRGNFSLGQRLDGDHTWSVALVDLDGDGDLDLVAGGETSGRVWLNNGDGLFSRGQRVDYGRYESIAAGDVTGDGIPDILASGEEAYRVWRGRGDGRFTADARRFYTAEAVAGR